MSEVLVGGHSYKVRLKPKEELLEVVGVEERRLQERWFRDYMDGQVGVLHYDDDKPDGSEYGVFWVEEGGGGTFWYYRLECLKILGGI